MTFRHLQRMKSICINVKLIFFNDADAVDTFSVAAGSSSSLMPMRAPFFPLLFEARSTCRRATRLAFSL